MMLTNSTLPKAARCRALSVNEINKMEKEEILNQFGKDFIKSVRDNSLFVFEGIVSGHMKSRTDRELHEAIKNLKNEDVELLRQIVYKMVDSTIHNTLFFFEQDIDDWKISNPERNATSLADISDGLCGELYSEEGWIEKYSEYKKVE